MQHASMTEFDELWSTPLSSTQETVEDDFGGSHTEVLAEFGPPSLTAKGAVASNPYALASRIGDMSGMLPSKNAEAMQGFDFDEDRTPIDVRGLQRDRASLLVERVRAHTQEAPQTEAGGMSRNDLYHGFNPRVREQHHMPETQRAGQEWMTMGTTTSTRVAPASTPELVVSDTSRAHEARDAGAGRGSDLRRAVPSKQEVAMGGAGNVSLYLPSTKEGGHLPLSRGGSVTTYREVQPEAPLQRTAARAAETRGGVAASDVHVGDGQEVAAASPRAQLRDQQLRARNAWLGTTHDSSFEGGQQRANFFHAIAARAATVVLGQRDASSVAVRTATDALPSQHTLLPTRLSSLLKQGPAPPSDPRSQNRHHQRGGLAGTRARDAGADSTPHARWAHADQTTPLPSNSTSADVQGLLPAGEEVVGKLKHRDTGKRSDVSSSSVRDAARWMGGADSASAPFDRSHLFHTQSSAAPSRVSHMKEDSTSVQVGRGNAVQHHHRPHVDGEGPSLHGSRGYQVPDVKGQTEERPGVVAELHQTRGSEWSLPVAEGQGPHVPGPLPELRLRS